MYLTQGIGIVDLSIDYFSHFTQPKFDHVHLHLHYNNQYYVHLHTHPTNVSSYEGALHHRTFVFLFIICYQTLNTPT